MQGRGGVTDRRLDSLDPYCRDLALTATAWMDPHWDPAARLLCTIPAEARASARKLEVVVPAHAQAEVPATGGALPELAFHVAAPSAARSDLKSGGWRLPGLRVIVEMNAGPLGVTGGGESQPDILEVRYRTAGALSAPGTPTEATRITLDFEETSS